MAAHQSTGLGQANSPENHAVVRPRRQDYSQTSYANGDSPPAKMLPRLRNILNFDVQTTTFPQPGFPVPADTHVIKQGGSGVPRPQAVSSQTQPILDPQYRSLQGCDFGVDRDGRRPEFPLISTPQEDGHGIMGVVNSSLHQQHLVNVDAQTETRDESSRQTSSIHYRTSGSTTSRTCGFPVGEISTQLSREPSRNRLAGSSSPDIRKRRARAYVGIKHDPGQGAYHLYDDGYRIPTQVHGEDVNPLWGLTKSNKARKRLALACLRCRERKIKCEPTSKSCTQCEKAEHPCCRAAECSETSGITGARPFSVTSKSLRSHGRQMSSSSLAKHSTSGSPLDEASGNSEFRTQLAENTLGLERVFTNTTASAQHNAHTNNPCTAEDLVTARLLHRYLSNVNDSIHCIFPYDALTNWLWAQGKKSRNETMVYHGMVAVASVFAGDEYIEIGRKSAEKAAKGAIGTPGKLDLGDVHTRLLLSIYSLAKGDVDAAWDYSGLAIRASSLMRYNLEEGCLAPPDKQNSVLDYGMRKAQLEEC